MSSDQSANTEAKGGNNNNNNNKKGHNRCQGGQQQPAATLEGSIPELGPNFYDCNSNRQVDQFITTTRLLADYFVMTQKNAGLFRNAILDQIHPIIPLVDRPALNDAGTVDPFDMSDYNSRRDARDKKLAQIDELNMTLYSAVWRQCTLTMRARLKEDNINYGTYSGISDGISLLKAIKSASQNYVSTTYRIDTINEALITLVTYKQPPHMSNSDYLDNFCNQREVYEQVGGHKVATPGALEYTAEKLGVEVIALTPAQRIEAHEREWTSIFIKNADSKQFASLQARLVNAFLDGYDNNPSTVEDAYTHMANLAKDTPNAPSIRSNNGVAFTTNGVANDGGSDATVLATNGTTTTTSNGNKKKGGGNAKNDNKDKRMDKQNEDKDSTDDNNSNATVAPTHLLPLPHLL
jgi:hypothetical protein